MACFGLMRQLFSNPEYELPQDSDIIGFNIPETTFWRPKYEAQTSARLPTSSQMVKDIVRCQREWEESLVNKAKSEELEEMLLQFIQHVNNEEGIGTQDIAETRAVLNKLKQENVESGARSSNPIPRAEVETRNLYKAWHHLREEVDAYNQAHGLLQDVFVRDLHRVLMTGVIDEKLNTRPGRYSCVPRDTRYYGKLHAYPSYRCRHTWEKAMQTITDKFNTTIASVKKELKDPATRLKATEKLFKAATWALYHIISLHPFSDGNGRLCRVLAAYILSLIAPFPSPIYNVHSPTQKSHFIDCIVSVRESLQAKGLYYAKGPERWESTRRRGDDQSYYAEQVNIFPEEEKLLNFNDSVPEIRDLAALLVESCWSVYREFIERLKRVGSVQK